MIRAEPGRVVGTVPPREEDKRLLTGRGRFVDDVRYPGMLHGAFLRSVVPHGRIVRVSVEAATALTGVVAVLTADDLACWARPLSFTTPFPGHRLPVFSALSGDKVRFVGDPVALVVAEERAIAEDALALIELEIEELPHVLTVEDARAPEAPAIFDELPDNVVYHALDEYGDIDGAFARVDRVVSTRIAQHRFTSSALETRGIVASYDPSRDELTYHASTKSPHMLRARLAEFLDHPQHRIRVLAGDVGGAFGGKGAIWREDIAVAAAAKQLGRAVKWIEDRNENLTAFGAAREETIEMEAAVRGEGEILGLRARMTMDHGAYPGMWLAPMFAALVRCTILSATRIRHFSFETTIAATNKATYISYRGPGASETLARERLLDAIGRELGIDPVEVRRRNLLTSAEQPWRMATGATVQRAHAVETLDRAVEVADYKRLRADQARARAEGRLVGIGVATSIQPCPAFPDWWESIGYPDVSAPARARLEPDGTVTLVTSEMPSGQGHETTLAQVTADALGVPLASIRVVTGDTHVTPFYYFGSGASRSSNIGAGAARAAGTALRVRIIDLASHLLEIDASDLAIVDGRIVPVDAPSRSLTLRELAYRAYHQRHTLPPDAEPELDVLVRYRQEEGQGGWAASAHICCVEVDPNLGTVRFRKYVVAEDCGPLIHPAIVEGQIRGGVAQGVGGALHEQIVYDEWGQSLCGTFMTYLLPSAMEVPEVEIDHLEIETDDPLGFRGVGESGAIMAPAAVASAVEDALQPFGVRVESLPLTPTGILELTGAIPGVRGRSSDKEATQPTAADREPGIGEVMR
jgi:aerobic carbon-monoxide dehydrogenase large subunit